MSTTNPLDELRSALVADNRKRVIELEEAATDALDTARNREEKYRQIAEAVEQTESESPNSKRLLQAAGEATQERSRLAGEMMGYLDGEASGSEVAETVKAVQSAQESVENHHEGVRAEASEVEIGVVLSVTGPQTISVPKGSTVSERFAVAQVGTGTATVECTVQQTSTLTVEPNRIDSLGGGDQRDVLLSGEPGTNTTAVLRVRSGQSVDQQPITVTVLTKAEYVSRARDKIMGLRSVVEDVLEGDNGETNNANGNGNGNNDKGSEKSLTAKITATLSKLDDAEKHIDNGNRNAANGAMTAAQQQLGAFINSLEAGSSNSIPTDTVSHLTVNAKYTIETLEDATNAAI